MDRVEAVLGLTEKERRSRASQVFEQHEQGANLFDVMARLGIEPKGIHPEQGPSMNMSTTIGAPLPVQLSPPPSSVLGAVHGGLEELRGSQA